MTQPAKAEYEVLGPTVDATYIVHHPVDYRYVHIRFNLLEESLEDASLALG